jgi:hypothetical protein
MKALIAPNKELLPYTVRTLFLAGGISNCGDWQSYVIEKLDNLNIFIINPRREGSIDRKDMVISTEQIKWEEHYLREAKEVLFWFPKTSVCPIALFELGKALGRQTCWDACCGCLYNHQSIYIGCDPEYDRIVDVKIQVSLVNPEIKIASSIDELIEQVKKA